MKPIATAVTGVSGYIGARVAQALVNDGHRVIAFGRGAKPPPQLASLSQFQYIAVTDAPSLVAAFVEHRVLRTVHCAGLFVGEHTAADVDPLIDANVRFATAIAEATAVSGGAFVNLASYWQDAECLPKQSNSLYAATKNAFDTILSYYEDRRSMPVQTLTIYDVYGEDDPRDKITTVLVRAALNGTPQELSSGYQLINLVHTDDIVSAIMLAHTRADAPTQRNAAIRSESFLSIRELVDVIESALAMPIDARWGARNDRTGEMSEPWDVYPVIEEWEPSIVLRDGIRRLAESQRHTSAGI